MVEHDAQILQVNHAHMVAEYIRTQIEMFDAARKDQHADEDSEQCTSKSAWSGHAALGGFQSAIEICFAEKKCGCDSTLNFRAKLSTCITDLLARNQKLPAGMQRYNVSANDKV